MVSFYKLFIVLLLIASVALVFNFSFARLCMTVNNVGVGLLQLFTCVGHSNSLDISKRLVCSLRAGRFHPYFNILLETVFSHSSTGSCVLGFMRSCVHAYTSPTQTFSPTRGI